MCPRVYVDLEWTKACASTLVFMKLGKDNVIIMITRL